MYKEKKKRSEKKKKGKWKKKRGKESETSNFIYTMANIHTTLLKHVSMGIAIQPPSRVCVPWLPFVALLFWSASTFTTHSDHGKRTTLLLESVPPLFTWCVALSVMLQCIVRQVNFDSNQTTRAETMSICALSLVITCWSKHREGLRLMSHMASIFIQCLI